MLIIDILVVIFLSYGFYLGIKRGFFVSVASFLSFLIGLIGAIKFSTLLKDYLNETFEWDSTFLPLISFILTFIVVILIVRLIAKFLTKVFNAVYLGLFNRFFGGVFEVLRIFLITCIIFVLFDKINVNHFIIEQDVLQTSFFYNLYEAIAEDVFPSLFKLFNYLFEKSSEVISIPQNTLSI